MIITCKECGAQISDKAKFCPKCGCPNKSKVSKLDITCMIFAGITLFYAMGSCLNDMFSQLHPYSAVPYVIVWFLLSLGFGIASIIKNKVSKLNIIGLIMGFSATVLAVIVSLVI